MILVLITAAWIVAAFVVVAIVALLWFFRRPRVGELFHQHVPDRPKRRLFLASLSFFVTFLGVRALTYCIHNNIGPFHDMEMGGRHIHHLVWGILILLSVGYAWLLELGSHGTEGSIFLGRLISLLYGAGAALTLDEFALWLNLRDVYWASEGRTSIDAVILFGALLSMGVWGGAFVHALVKEIVGKRR